MYCYWVCRMIKGDLVFEHETRKMIYHHIIAHPGVSFKVLKRVFGLNDSTLRYHLDYLEKADEISFGLEKGKREYYPNQNKHIIIRNDDTSSGFLQLTARQDQILNTIKRNPGITQKELLGMTGMKRLTLINNINKLMDLCIVRRVPENTHVCYEYLENEQLKYEILKQLVVKLLRHEITEQKFLELKRKLEE